MNKWAVLGFVGTALIGALAFLRVTANEIALVDKIIRRKFDEIERKRRQMQQEAEANADPVTHGGNGTPQNEPVRTVLPAADDSQATIS